MAVDPVFWLHRRVLVTGHTGFKGIWLCALLRALGAETAGIALPPDHAAPLWRASGLEADLEHHLCDLRDGGRVQALVRAIRPEIVFHLAARPLVQEGLQDPLATFAVNLGGTLNLLDALRGEPDLRAVVVVTTDKVYRAETTAHREDAPLGGEDPYSASKAAVELAVACWRRCYLPPEDGVGLATARAGNVIGAGDFAPGRLVPDIVRGVFAGEPVVLRHPDHRRPWQHVLDALDGYLRLAQALAREPARFSGAFNFGPDADRPPTVAELARRLLAHFGRGELIERPREDLERPHLALDSGRARRLLGWAPRLDLETTLRWTAEGYRELLEEGTAGFLERQIADYAEAASAREAAA